MRSRRPKGLVEPLRGRPVEDSELLRQITRPGRCFVGLQERLRCMTQLLHSQNEVLEQFLQAFSGSSAS